MLGVGILILSGMTMPLLLGLLDKPALVVYDPGHSTILSGLAASEEFRLRVVETPEDMRTLIGTASEVALGLELPEDFDRRAGSQELLQLTGYFVHWAGSEQIEALTAFFESRLSGAAWGAVEIRPSAQPVYPGYTPDGYLVMSIQTMMVAILTMGVVLVPLLIIEEKECKTFQVLLVSPAGLRHIIAGKAIAGMAYCLAAALVVLFLTAKYIVSWPLAAWAVLLAAMFAVGIGILLGLLAETQAALSLWSGLVLLFLLSSGMLQFFDTTAWAGWVQAVLNWLPTTGIFRMLGLALTDNFPLSVLWQTSATLLGAIGLVFLLALGQLRRSER